MYRVESLEILGTAKSLFLNIFPYFCIEWEYFSPHLINTELKFHSFRSNNPKLKGEDCYHMVTYLAKTRGENKVFQYFGKKDG
jgi:hypothetical protein